MANSPGILLRLISGFWTLLDQGRRIIVNLLFLLLIYFVIKITLFTDTPEIPEAAALVLNPSGYIVEQLDYIDPMDELFNELDQDSDKVPQTLLKDLLTAINLAQSDSAISALVLDLRRLYGASPSKLQDIAKAIQNFKTTGKKVYAYSVFYNQAQYFIAAQADEVYMDPLGSVYIEGYGRFNTYFKGALDKLGINFHIFKVGTYKSAIEPFSRNDMSSAAKEANMHYLGDLWQSYRTDIAAARELTAEDIDQYSNNFLINLSRSKEGGAALALSASLVDSLMTEQEFTHYMIEEVGSDHTDNDFQQIYHTKYLKIVDAPKMLDKFAEDSVAVIVAKGVIYNGNKKSGSIGGESTAKLIRRARLDPTVKALVLRVDSPGGSAYASEIIRREVLRFKDAGKPIVVSMGSYAASGGYWISASADEIWASPTTITGSIGIFGLLPTFEEPLNNAGIYRDGVGTTKLSGAFDAGKPLRKDVGDAIQNSINNGYRRFLEIVSKGRNMSMSEVDKVAQGRVWSGKTAQKIGLVDRLGDLQQAIESAANKAGLIHYKIQYIELELSDSERFFKNLFSSSLMANIVSRGSSSQLEKFVMLSPTRQLLQQIQDGYQALVSMDDPQSLYVHCLCSVD